MQTDLDKQLWIPSMSLGATIYPLPCPEGRPKNVQAPWAQFGSALEITVTCLGSCETANSYCAIDRANVFSL